ncbi:MAG: hypothetical protein MHM6MM_002852 [Cercozoa sp. M6MM]
MPSLVGDVASEALKPGEIGASVRMLWIVLGFTVLVALALKSFVALLFPLALGAALWHAQSSGLFDQSAEPEKADSTDNGNASAAVGAESDKKND